MKHAKVIDIGMRGLYRNLLEPGSTLTIRGERGKGKTFLSTVLADFFLRDVRDDEERFVLTNVFYMKKVPRTAEEKSQLGERLQRIEIDPDGFMVKYPRRIISVRSLAQAMLEVSERNVDAKRRGVKVVRYLWVCDEAGIAFSSGTHFMSKQASGLKQFLSIQRKFGISNKGDDGGMTSVFIFPEESMVLGAIREEASSTIKAILSKDPRDIARYGARYLGPGGYDAKQLLILIYPRYCNCRKRGDLHEVGCRGVNVHIVTGSPHAKPLDVVQMGDIVYSPGSPAAFDIISPHPAAPHKMFDPEELWRVLSSVLETKAPDLLYRYMHNDPDILPEVRATKLAKFAAKMARGDREQEIASPEPVDREKVVVPLLIERFRSGIKDAKEASVDLCTPRWARKIKVRWEAGCYDENGKRTEVPLP